MSKKFNEVKPHFNTILGTIKNIEPIVMFATVAFHTLGDLTRTHGDACKITHETDDYFVGSWLSGFGFVSIIFPKETTRILKIDEVLSMSRSKIVVSNSFEGSIIKPEKVNDYLFAAYNRYTSRTKVRRVPSTWQHPTKDNEYIPLLNDYAAAKADWDLCEQMLKDGKVRSWDKNDNAIWVDNTDFITMSYYGNKPIKSDYMPTFAKDKAICFQGYENISEGTPITPIFENMRDLLDYLNNLNY